MLFFYLISLLDYNIIGVSLLTLLLFSICILLFFERRLIEITIILCCFMFCFLFIFFTSNLFTIFILLEIALICFYIYSTYDSFIKYTHVISVFRFFQLSSISSLLLLVGILPILHGPHCASYSIFFPFTTYNLYSVVETSQIVYVFFCFLVGLIGFLLKIGSFPFQTWYYDIFSGLRLKSLFFIAVILKFGYFYFFVLYINAYSFLFFDVCNINEFLLFLFFFIGVFNFVFGCILLVNAVNLAEFIIGSGLLGNGYFFFSFFCGTELWLSIILYYYFGLIIVFCSFFIIEHLWGKSEDTSEWSFIRLSALFTKYKILAFFFSLSILNLAGFPPSFFFFLKLHVVSSCIENIFEGHIDGTLCIFILLVTNTISYYAYIRLLIILFCLPENPLCSWINYLQKLKKPFSNFMPKNIFSGYYLINFFLFILLIDLFFSPFIYFFFFN